MTGCASTMPSNLQANTIPSGTARGFTPAVGPDNQVHSPMHTCMSFAGTSSSPVEDDCKPEMHQTTSCVSIHRASFHSKPQGGTKLPLIVAELVEEDRQTSVAAASPSGGGEQHNKDVVSQEQQTKQFKPKRTRSFKKMATFPSLTSPFPLVTSLKKSLKDGEFSNSFSSLRTKLRYTGYSRPTTEKSFEGICLALGVEDRCEFTSNVAVDRFPLQYLELAMGLLNGNKFNLALPPPVKLDTCHLDSGLGHDEEQGDGGTCDQFIGTLPESCRHISQKASPLGLVPKLLPHGIISREARYVGSCFWIWLCIVDDLTENLTGTAWEETEADLFRVFSKNLNDDSYFHKDSDPVKVSLALRHVIETTMIRGNANNDPGEIAWREQFMAAVCEVLTGFREERPLLESERISLDSWMRLRIVTISVRPFMILARADLGLAPTVSKFGDPLHNGYSRLVNEGCSNKIDELTRVEVLLQLIMGLQNDILGWEKDHKTDNPLSAIQVLIQNGLQPATAVAEVVAVHNMLVSRCIEHANNAWANPANTSLRSEAESSEMRSVNYSVPSIFGLFRQSTSSRRRSMHHENVRRYVELISGFANGMATWMAVSKRYVA